MNWKNFEAGSLVEVLPWICLEGLSKTTKIFTLDSWFPGRDSIRAAFENESKALRLRQNARYTGYRSLHFQRLE
jgi:hypothetical protein